MDKPIVAMPVRAYNVPDDYWKNKVLLALTAAMILVIVWAMLFSVKQSEAAGLQGKFVYAKGDKPVPAASIDQWDSYRFVASLSHYWPPLGGVNCANFVNGACVSKTNSGEAWQDWVGVGAACPPAFPFGTIVEMLGHRFVCVDRGGMVTQRADGSFWIDVLQPDPLLGYGYGVTVDAVLYATSALWHTDRELLKQLAIYE